MEPEMPLPLSYQIVTGPFSGPCDSKSSSPFRSCYYRTLTNCNVETLLSVLDLTETWDEDY
jgi:hypothetical protein